MTTVAPAEAQTTAVVIPANRFIRSSARHTEQAFDSGDVALGSNLDNIEVPANGYLRSVIVKVTGTTAANAATVAFAEDGPFAALAAARLSDINGANLFGPMSGWDWMTAIKFGGYRNENRVQLLPGYSAVTGAGATGGSFSFMLRIPVEVNPRDGFGSLPNMNAASALKLGFSVGNSAAIYSTPPTTDPTVRIQTAIETWLIPAATDANGVPNTLVPPALGSYQRWLKSTFPVVQGDNRFRLPNVSNNLRTLIAVYRDDSGTPVRDDSELPVLWQLDVDGYSREVIRTDQLRQRMAEDYGYTEAVSASGTGIQTGTVVWQFTDELDGKPGFETRELYMPTNSATRLELAGQFGGAGRLDVLWNDVVVPDDIDRTGFVD